MRSIFDYDKAVPIMRAAPPGDAVDKAAGVAVSCGQDLPGTADGDVPAVDGAACVRREARFGFCLSAYSAYMIASVTHPCLLLHRLM